MPPSHLQLHFLLSSLDGTSLAFLAPEAISAFVDFFGFHDEYAPPP